ncbi:MAG: alpha/beta hydrolase family esterase [Acidimicrobiales bacterium]
MNASMRRLVPILAGSLMCLSLSGLSATVASLASASSTTTGCSSPGASTTLTLKVNGFSRTVIVHVPRDSSDTTPRALVFNLHGSGGTALDQELTTDMNKASNQDGFIVAYPQALIPLGKGFDWNVPNEPLVLGEAVPKGAANDIEFLAQLVGILESKYCVNKDEVYATGISGGAREASQLACDESGIFAAVAPVSGLRRPTPCPTNRAVPVISFHGSADPIDPFEGHGEAYWTYSVPTAAKYWSEQDHCSTKSTTSTPFTGVKLTSYSSCADRAAVELYEVMGEGHEWPGGPALPKVLTKLLGPQSNAINANAVMWSFFQAHPLSS